MTDRIQRAGEYVVPQKQVAGDMNAVLTFADYLEGRRLFEELYDTEPTRILAGPDAMGDLKTDSKGLVQETDLLRGDSETNVLARQAIYKKLVGGGDGVMDDLPVYKIEDESDKYPTVIIDNFWLDEGDIVMVLG